MCHSDGARKATCCIEVRRVIFVINIEETNRFNTRVIGLSQKRGATHNAKIRPNPQTGLFGITLSLILVSLKRITNELLVG